MKTDLQSNTFLINKWYLDKTGISKLHYTENRQLQDGSNVVVKLSIPRLSDYYFQYKSVMRGEPKLVILTPDAYEAQWIEQCLVELTKRSLEDIPKSVELIDMAKSLFASHGKLHTLDPSQAIDAEFGTHRKTWVDAVAQQLLSKAGSDEYEAVAGIGGETPKEQAEYLYKHYSADTPNRAVSRYFGLVDRVKHSKITEGVLLRVVLPKFLQERFEVKAIELVSSKADYKQNVLTLTDYQDDDKLIFKLLEEWMRLASDKNLPQGVYASTGELNGVNNVSFLKEQRELVEVYPVAVSPRAVELHYLEN